MRLPVYSGAPGPAQPLPGNRGDSRLSPLRPAPRSMSLPLPLPEETVPQYRPRPASNQLQEIVADSMEELFQVWDERFQENFGALHARVRTLLERFLRCVDLHFGFLRLRCTNPHCPKKTERLIPTSCKVRGLCTLPLQSSSSRFFPQPMGLHYRTKSVPRNLNSPTVKLTTTAQSAESVAAAGLG